MFSIARCVASLSAIAFLLPLPAAAHHPMGGVAPATAWDGMLSGFAHPVIGLDHLAFLLAAGVIAAAAPGRGGLLSLVVLLASALAGAALHLAGWNLGLAEAMVALSVVAAGLTLIMPVRRLPDAARLGLALTFAAAGSLHGYALAEAVNGSPAPAIAAYLVALAVAQALLAGGAIILTRRMGSASMAVPLRHRLAGVAVTLVGAVTLANALFA